MKEFISPALANLHRGGQEKYKKLISAYLPAAALCVWAFALGRAQGFLNTSPFGAALLCSAPKLLPPLTVSVCLGAAAGGRILMIPLYVFILLFRLIAQINRGDDCPAVTTPLCAVATAIYGLIEVFLLPGGASLLKSVVNTVVAVTLKLCFYSAFTDTGSRRSGVLAAVYATSCALSGISLYGIGLANLLGFIICINLARYSGGAFGCAAGALWGLGSAPSYTPAFAIGALIGGRTASPLLGVGAAAIFCMMFATFAGGYYGVRDFLPDIAIAAILYAPISNLGWMKWDFFTESKQENEAQSSAEKEKERRLGAVAGALGSLSAIFYGMSDRLKDTPDYASEKDMTCVFAEDYAAMSELITSSLKQEEGGEDHILAGKIYGMLRMSRIRCAGVTATDGRVKHIHIRGMQASVMDDPELLRVRVGNLCGAEFLPPDFSVDERGVHAHLTAAPALAVQWHICSRPKSGEIVNGDTTTAFTTQDGRFYCLLCDGMGSGKNAAVASRICCVFLQKMLEGGAEPSLSIKMLNTFLRGKGYECFATIDMFCLDLHTAEAFFIKGGSAPSHLFRKGCEYTMSSASAPVGIIREVYAERITFTAKPGDRIVMKSDGAPEWEIPKPPASPAPDRAAQELLDMAVAEGSRDDITVCVINIEPGGEDAARKAV